MLLQSPDILLEDLTSVDKKDHGEVIGLNCVQNTMSMLFIFIAFLPSVCMSLEWLSLLSHPVI